MLRRSFLAAISAMLPLSVFGGVSIPRLRKREIIVELRPHDLGVMVIADPGIATTILTRVLDLAWERSPFDWRDYRYASPPTSVSESLDGYFRSAKEGTMVFVGKLGKTYRDGFPNETWADLSIKVIEDMQRGGEVDAIVRHR